MRANESQLSMIYENTFDTIFVLGVGSEIVSDSFRSNEATGIQQDQVLGKLMQDVIPEPASAVTARQSLIAEHRPEVVRRNRWNDLLDLLSDVRPRDSRTDSRPEPSSDDVGSLIHTTIASGTASTSPRYLLSMDVR